MARVIKNIARNVLIEFYFQSLHMRSFKKSKLVELVGDYH